MESDVNNNQIQVFKNIDDEYENNRIEYASFMTKNNDINPDNNLQSKVDYKKFVTIIQPDPKKPNIRVSFKNNEMISNDTDTDSKNDTFSLTSNDQDDKQQTPQHQQQSNSDKYNISNVLKHIYALKHVQRSDENNSGSSRQFWMPDDQVKECFECNDKFTTFRRRHHCRVCGQIFCSKCSDYEIPSQLIWPNSTGNIRACTFCWKFVDQMETGDLKHNTKSIKELMKRLSLSATSYYPFSQNNSDTNEQSSKINTNESPVTAQIAYRSSSIQSNVTNQSLSASNSSFSNSSLMINNSSSASLNPNSSNLLIDNNNIPADDNNPFDITENKDYFKSQDIEIKQLIINNSLELRNLWVQIYHTSDGLVFQTRSINKFKKVNNCITGNELVEWLIRTKSVTRDQAIVIGQALCQGKWLECAYYNNPNINNNINNHHLFYDDNSFYKPGWSALNCNRNDPIFEKKQVANDIEEGPEWIKELNKLIAAVDEEPVNSINNNIITVNEVKNENEIKVSTDDSSDEHIIIPMIKIETTAKVVDDAPFLSNLTIITGSSQSASPLITPAKSISPKSTKTLNIINDNLLDLHKQLQIDLCRQLLKLKNLSMDWYDIIMPIVWKCVDLVKPDVKHDNDLMDIRNYIKIKKLTNLDKKETRIVNGLVFTKNVAHKEMKKNLANPKILLLRSSIEYQRTNEKMCSLEPIFTAESQYLKNSCSKLLLRHNPEILIVEKSVARIAQEIFLQSNVSLILNVKSKIMDKLCRFLQADPMYSIDDLVRKPKLGICSKFYVENFKTQTNRAKTLMFFEGTPTNLGCTILLCGSSLNELRAIKSLTNFLIYAAYNSKLEHSFILDKYADFEIKKSLHDAINEPEKFAEKLTHLKTIENNKNLTQSNTNINIKANDSETKTHPIFKKEISIDQSPLDEIKNKKYNSDEDDDEEDKDSSDSNDIRINDSQLKLTICNKHSEKNSFNLSRNFKQLLDDLILSCSPFISHRVPILINENNTDPLIKYLPDSYMNYLKSNILLKDSAACNRLTSISSNDNLNILHENNDTQIHDFLLMHLTKSFDNEEFKKLYADYKSRGGIAATLNSPKRLYLSDAFSNGFDLSDQNETNKSKTNKDKESQLGEQIYDCLDIFNRQHLAVLFYSQCETSPVFPNICNKPRVINMKFYSDNDMTLGSFLAKNCFRHGYKCNNELCNTLIVYHTRTFVHCDSKITVRMSVVPSAPSATITQTVSSSPATTSTNPVSTTLDDKHKPQQQFSNLNVTDLILNTSFKSTGTTGETMANSSSANLNLPSQNNSLKSPSSESLPKTAVTQSEQPTQPQTIYDEFNIYMWSVCKICNKSTKKLAMSPDTWSFSFAKFLELTFYASDYHQFYNSDDQPTHCCKHSLFQDHYQYFRFKNIVTVFSTSKISIRTLYLPCEVLKSNGFIRSRSEYIDEIKDLFEKGLVLFSTLVERICTIKALNLGEKQTQKLDKYISEINQDQTLKHKIEKINLLLTNSSHLNESILNGNLVDSVSALNTLNEININESNNIEQHQQQLQQVNYDLIEMLLIDLRKYIANSANNWNNKMTDFFKKSTKVNEEITALSGDNLNPLHRQQTKEGKYGLGESTNESTSVNLLGLNEPITPTPRSFNEANTGMLSQLVNEEEHKTTPSTISLGKRFIANSFIANLIPSSVYQPLKVPFPEDEHYLLGSDSTYYVNDKNLSSIVAFSLSSKEYKEFQANSCKNLLNKEITFQLNEISDTDSVTSIINQQNKLHFEHQFHDSTTKFYCKAYYADLFSKLRRLIMPNEEDKYIHSLFRCMNWDAKGGKSNSQFRKTIDNRFVLKELSKQEVQSFLDFAPHYVQYITDSIQNKKATALAKILGAYQICLMKNTTISSKAVKMDVIVLENLFYGKKFSQVFDLKGSERNRMVNINNQANKQPEKDLVLLDENFLRWSFDNPIYIKPHSKYVLMKAIEADSQFLSSKFVMDYSLLCGFDQVNDELVVGIIDYLRVFTWDKKVETYLKTISGQGKMPTIVSPEVYRKRFINAIDRYFLAVPDQWYQDTYES